jgi:NAD(P)-dependent dehydrogenase (short-subunit alcohol dehydrogenase family)
MIHKKQANSIGLEYNFSVNLFSGWLLTRLLLPKLKASTTGRVVRVEDTTMRFYLQQLLSIDNDVIRWHVA